MNIISLNNAVELLDFIEKYEDSNNLSIFTTIYDHNVSFKEIEDISKILNQKDCAVKTVWLVSGKVINDYIFFRHPDKKESSDIDNNHVFLCFTTKEMNASENLFNPDRFDLGIYWLSDILVNTEENCDVLEDHCDMRTILELRQEAEDIENDED